MLREVNGEQIYILCAKEEFMEIPTLFRSTLTIKIRNKNQEHSYKYLLHINESINQYNQPSF